jgi:hypothetical protein
MPRPNSISRIHELKYELRIGHTQSSEVAKLQEMLDQAIEAACLEYRCSKAELLRTIAPDFGKWIRDERLPRLENDLQ